MRKPETCQLFLHHVKFGEHLNRFFFDGGFKLNPVLFNLGVQCRSGKAEEFGRAGAIPACETKGLADKDTGNIFHTGIEWIIFGSGAHCLAGPLVDDDLPAAAGIRGRAFPADNLSNIFGPYRRPAIKN